MESRDRRLPDVTLFLVSPAARGRAEVAGVRDATRYRHRHVSICDERVGHTGAVVLFLVLGPPGRHPQHHLLPLNVKPCFTLENARRAH